MRESILTVLNQRIANAITLCPVHKHRIIPASPKTLTLSIQDSDERERRQKSQGNDGQGATSSTGVLLT